MLKNTIIKFLGGFSAQEYNSVLNLLVENRADILATKKYMTGVDEMLVKIVYKIDALTPHSFKRSDKFVDMVMRPNGDRIPACAQCGNGMDDSRHFSPEGLLNEIDMRFAEVKTILQSNTFQNHFDMTKKARGWKASWKLTEDQKEAIRNEAGTHEELGKKYGVSRSYIGFIKRGK